MKSKLSPVEDSGSTAPKKVFIVEDHPVFREGLVQIINSEGDLTVCGEAEDAEHALEAIPSLKPDLVLVARMKLLSGLKLNVTDEAQDGRFSIKIKGD